MCDLTLETGMRQQKDPSKDYYIGQPVNKPIDIARAIASLAADESNHSTAPTVVTNASGKSVICVDERYYETEGSYLRLLPEIASSEVTENWERVLEVNPFKHMSK